jgi:hypothetical protein
MWKWIVPLLIMIGLGGCSLDSLSALNEVDKVQLVQKNAYMKRYRAYFVRTHLRPIRRGKKYLFFYNARKKDLAILLHPGRHYKLYSINHPHKIILTVSGNRKTRLRHVYKALARKGYHLTSPSRVGFSSRVRLRRYKGFKTLMVDVKDYRHLRNLYRKAIRTYDASRIKRIKTRLPKHFVLSYLRRYEKRATTARQKEQLRIIASKLGVSSRFHATTATPKPDQSTTVASATPVTPVAPTTPATPEHDDSTYRYYRNQASYTELNRYLESPESDYTLTHKQRKALQERRRTLKETYLLQHGSLEALIAAYKKNNDPRYKARIMTLMKEAQERERSATQ